MSTWNQNEMIVNAVHVSNFQLKLSPFLMVFHLDRTDKHTASSSICYNSKSANMLLNNDPLPRYALHNDVCGPISRH